MMNETSPYLLRRVQAADVMHISPDVLKFGRRHVPRLVLPYVESDKVQQLSYRYPLDYAEFIGRQVLASPLERRMETILREESATDEGLILAQGAPQLFEDKLDELVVRDKPGVPANHIKRPDIGRLLNVDPSTMNDWRSLGIWEDTTVRGRLYVAKSMVLEATEWRMPEVVAE